MGRNILKLETAGLQPLIDELIERGANVEKAVTDALEQSADTIHEDTVEALAVANLPAQGRYSKGYTREAVINDTHARVEGGVVWIPVGFDFSKRGAGGFLITGTPRMQPDRQLHAMYKQKRYMRGIQEDMWDVVSDYVTGAAK